MTGHPREDEVSREEVRTCRRGEVELCNPAESVG